MLIEAQQINFSIAFHSSSTAITCLLLSRKYSFVLSMRDRRFRREEILPRELYKFQLKYKIAG